MNTRDNISHIQMRIIITKAHGKSKPDWLKIFSRKCEKSETTV